MTDNKKTTEEIPVVTCAKMKELENAADAAGLSYYQMMENAGRCAAVIAMGNCPALIKNGDVFIFCGKGNNGGDGLVIARLLSGYGANVSVILVEGTPATADASKNFDLISDSKIHIINIENGDDMPDMHEAVLIIDGIYGTGFHGSLRSRASKVIDEINQAKENGVFILALDLPSGLSGDNRENEPEGKCVHADSTVTFHCRKGIHINKKAREFLGEVTVANIGINDTLDPDNN